MLVRWIVVVSIFTSATAHAQSGETAPSGREPSALIADFNLLLGEKFLDHGEWGDLDEQFTTGMETTWRMPRWRVGIAADGLFSNAEKRRGAFAEEVITRASTLELGLGLRAIVPLGRLRPYVGAGAALVQGDVQVIRRQDADEAAGAGGLGWWAGGGVYGRLGETANLGVSVRWSQAHVRSGGFEADAGGMTYALVLGFGIPPYFDPAD